ncbi:MAG: hypothetical protein ACXVZO_11745 [Gaiellaceae bacterium]
MFQRLASLLTCLAAASFLSSGVHALHLKVLSLDAGSASASPNVATVPVRYTVNGRNVDSVALSLQGSAPRSVRVRLSVDGSWYRCETTGRTARCATPGLTVAAVDRVTVSPA